MPSEKLLKIVGLGDSTTAGTPGFLSPVESPPRGDGDEQSQYAYWMMKAHPEWDVLNRGINGERSDEVLSRFQRDVSSEEPDLVVILAGVNDIYQGYAVSFSEGNLLEMYDRAMELGATPVACTVLPYNTMGPNEAMKRLDLNRWVTATCAGLKIPCCDTAKAVAEPSNADRLAGTPDGLHPDVQGYRKMAEAISRVVEMQTRGFPGGRFSKH